MTQTLTSAQAASPEESREMAQRLQIDLLPLQAQGITGSMTIDAVPETLRPWPDVRMASHAHASARLTLNPRLLADIIEAMEGYQSHAIGLRQMEMSTEDVAELRRRQKHPSAFPRLPIRRVRTDNVDQLD